MNQLPSYTIKREWGKLPFLLSLFIQGMPLSGSLTPYEKEWASMKAESIVEQAVVVGQAGSAFPTVAWGLLYIVALIWFLKRPKVLNIFVGKAWPMLLFVLSVFAGLFTSNYPMVVLSNAVHTIGTLLVCLAAAYCYKDNTKAFVGDIALVVGGNVVFQAAAVLLIPDVAIAGQTQRWRGFLSHPNSLGMLSFVAVWANLVSIKAYKLPRRSFHRALAVVALITLLGTQSMTSLVSFCVMLATYFAFKNITASKKTGILLVGVFLLCACFLSGVYLAVGHANTLALLGKSSDLSGRFQIWALATEAIRERPLMGWGFDGNATVNQWTGLPFTHHHNGYLETWIRGGIALLLSLLVIVYRVLFQAAGNTEFRTELIPFVIAILLFNTSEVSFFNQRNVQFLIFVSIFFLVTLCGDRRLPTGSSSNYR